MRMAQSAVPAKKMYCNMHMHHESVSGNYSPQHSCSFFRVPGANAFTNSPGVACRVGVMCDRIYLFIYIEGMALPRPWLRLACMGHRVERYCSTYGIQQLLTAYSNSHQLALESVILARTHHQ